MGDLEVVDGATRVVQSQGQGSAKKRGDRDGALSQLRKRKKLFGREWRLYARKMSPSLLSQKKSVTDCISEHTKKSTHSVKLISSQTHVMLLHPHLSYLLFAQQNLHRFIRCFVPSGSHRVEPVGGSGCGSSFALQDQRYQRKGGDN